MKTGEKGYIVCSSLSKVVEHAKVKCGDGIQVDSSNLQNFEMKNNVVNYRPDWRTRLGMIRYMHQSCMIRELEISWFYYNWKHVGEEETLSNFSKFLIGFEKFINLLRKSAYTFGRLFIIHKVDKKTKPERDSNELQKLQLKRCIVKFILFLFNVEYETPMEETIENIGTDDEGFQIYLNGNMAEFTSNVIDKIKIDNIDCEVLNNYYTEGATITTENLQVRIQEIFSTLVMSINEVMMTKRKDCNSDRIELESYACSKVDLGLEMACLQQNGEGFSKSFVATSEFPNLDDARVMQFISKYCVSTGSITNFMKMQEATVQVTDTTKLGIIDIQKLAWNSELMVSFNVVHSIVYKFLYDIIRYKFTKLNDKSTKSCNTNEVDALLTMMEKILHYRLPQMLLNYIYAFQGLFNVNEKFDMQLPYTKPIDHSIALSLLYSSFHQEDFCSHTGEMHGRYDKLSLFTRSRPASIVLYNVFNDHKAFISLIRLTTFSNLGKYDYDAILSLDTDCIRCNDIDGESPSLLYDVVLTFFARLKNQKLNTWKNGTPSKWMPRTTTKDKTLIDEINDRKKLPNTEVHAGSTNIAGIGSQKDGDKASRRSTSR